MKNFFEKCKNKIKKVRSFLAGKKYLLLWEKAKKENTEGFLNKTERNEKIIVSLTSFPGRIHVVPKTIKTILNQCKVKADVVELWLAEEQFANKEADLPEELLELKKYGLTIQWCTDLRSYKKLLPALKAHPDDIIVTADDDVYYKNDWLEKLYLGYLNDKRYIYCHKVTKFVLKGEQFRTIGGGKKFYRKPSFLNKLVGVGGVLYPPHSLHEQVFETSVFEKEAPTNDDIWFWFMAIKNNVRISVVKENTPKPIDVYEAYATEKLTDINDKGEKLFWVQFHNLCEVFPDVLEKLMEETRVSI